MIELKKLRKNITLQDKKRAKYIKQAMKEAHALGYSNNEDDYHNYIHQRIDELIGEYK